MNADALRDEEATVLIVDDTPANLAVIVDSLEQNAVQVAVAQDAEEALARAEFLQPDLILLDVVMPGVNGFELCRRLKSQERTRDIPVIFMTASAATEDKLTGFAVGAVDYVTKPLHVAEVRARVNAQLSLRRMQKKLQAQNIRLEREIGERARIEEQLRHSNSELESFSYSVSHDLRAPLRAISACASLLSNESSGLTPLARERLEKIIDAAQRMDTLIRDLLEYARTGRMRVKLGPVPLAPIVRRSIAMFAGRMAAGGARVELIEPFAAPVGDPLLLEQILSNLIDNALKYRGAAPAQVTVSAVRMDEHVQLSVSDNGIGIDPKYHDQIFQVFQRLHAHSEYPGTGIGLAIVARAARLMNGTIRVNSAAGEGSTFFVSLPAASDAAATVPDELDAVLRNT